MKYCIFCDKEIDKESVEHILLNSLGGKLTCKNIICKSCNNSFGTEIDSKLCDVLYPYASLLNVNRDRGNNKNILTNDDTDYYMKPMGVPVLKKYKISEENIDGGNVHISIEASDIKQSKQAIKWVKSKYGNRLDENSFVIETKNQFLNEKIPFKVTISPKMFPSIIKSAIEFCKVKIDVDISDAIRRFNKKDYVDCYYCFEDVVNIKYESIFHIISLFKFDKKLYCYISYFSIFGFLVKLANNINTDIEESYVQDLLKDDIVDTSNYIINKEVLNDFNFNNGLIKDNSEKIKKKIGNFIKLYREKSMIDIINRIYDESAAELENDHKKNVSEKDVFNKFLEKIVPYLEYWIG